MLPKINRLVSRASFVDLKTAGRKYQSSSFALLYKENNQDFCRFGFIVSKRVSLKATERNTVKRKLSAVIFKLIPSLSNNYDFLFLVKKEIIKNKSFEIEKEVVDLFKRLGTIK